MNTTIWKGVLGIVCITFAIVWSLRFIWPCETSPTRIAFAIQTSSVKTTVRNVTSLDSIWLRQIHQREIKIYSQNGEDGILLWIFVNIGTVNSPPRFVEFGTENGDQCNSRFLRQHLGWEGLLMDGSHDIPAINLHKEMITAQNINSLLEKYHTPPLLDLLSIDLDFDDYFVWKAILQTNRFHARVVIIEYNYSIPPNENRVVDASRDSRRWTGTNHFGAGILAMAALGRAYNYTLIYAEKNGVNLFFVRKDILVQQGILHAVPSVEQIHIKRPSSGWRHPDDPNQTRPWLWNDTAWI